MVLSENNMSAIKENKKKREKSARLVLYPLIDI